MIGYHINTKLIQGLWHDISNRNNRLSHHKHNNKTVVLKYMYLWCQKWLIDWLRLRDQCKDYDMRLIDIAWLNQDYNMRDVISRLLIWNRWYSLVHIDWWLIDRTIEWRLSTMKQKEIMWYHQITKSSHASTAD